MGKRNKVRNIYTDNQKTNKLPIIILVSVLALLMVGTVVVIVAKPFSKKPSTGEYFGYDAKIISSTPAKEFKNISTPSEAKDKLNELGFENYKVITSYSIEGEYLGENTVKDDDIEQHPTYDIQYVTPSGDLWIIYIYGDQIMANPASYNIQSSRNVRILISEKETLTSYNSKENCFYEIIPAETELFLFTVDTIDAETINGFTTEALDKL